VDVSWISSAHERWLAGEELDVKADLQDFRLQPFLGLRIAISGIEPRKFSQGGEDDALRFVAD
jgi:hypothetical protein